MIASLHLSGLRLFVTNLSPGRMQIGLQETGYGNKETNSQRRGWEGFGELPLLMYSHLLSYIFYLPLHLRFPLQRKCGKDIEEKAHMSGTIVCVGIFISYFACFTNTIFRILYFTSNTKSKNKFNGSTIHNLKNIK